MSPSAKPPLRASGWAIASAACALAATGVGLTDLLDSRTFDWHLEQTSLRDGLVVHAVFALLIAAALRIPSVIARAIAVVLPVALLLRIYAIDFAALLSGYYVLGLWFVGVEVERRTSASVDREDRVRRAAIFAVTAGGLALWTAGVLGAGFEASRALGLAVALLGWTSAVLRWRANHWSMPVFARPTGIMALAAGLAASCLLAVLVRSNSVLYYDSIWYGLRPDRVLFGTNGIYSFLGLTTQVHYYPKLYEVAVAPLYGWDDLSPVIGFNVWTMLLLFIALKDLAIGTGVERVRASVIAVALACFPAVAGVAETSKGDILCAAFVVFAARALQKYVAQRDDRALADVLCCALIAAALRLSALPWLAVLCLLTLGAIAIRMRREVAAAWAWLRGPSGLMVIGALSLAALVHARTWLLTGTPIVTNASTQLLLDRWGMGLRFPVGALTGGEPPAGLRGLADFTGIALAPHAYTFHVIKWLGGLWLGAALVGLLHGLVAGRGAWWRGSVIPLALGLALPLLLCLNSWPVAGGDGNYFIVPAACLAIVGFAGMSPSRIADGLLLTGGALGLFAYLLTSNWIPGTAPWQPRFDRDPRDQPAQIGAYIDEAGLGRVAMGFGQCHRLTRVVGLLPENGQAFALPIRFEPLVEWSWNNRGAFRSAERFTALMRATGTQFVVLPKSAEHDVARLRPELHAFTARAMEQLVAQRRARVAGDLGGFRVYRYLETAPPRGCPNA
ncbi:hypothetical protein [Lysobacter humi (ex Lee et al. 2017)]